jgi:hypothetical protein
MGKLKLFVFDGFCPDFSDGLAFAIAETEEEAKKIIIKEIFTDPKDWGILRIHDLSEKVGYGVRGGGG